MGGKGVRETRNKARLKMEEKSGRKQKKDVRRGEPRRSRILDIEKNKRKGRQQRNEVESNNRIRKAVGGGRRRKEVEQQEEQDEEQEESEKE